MNDVAEVQNPLTVNAVVARVRLIQEVMQKIMKKDTHYGTIPGCKKPSLYKPGAEQLLVTFRIAPAEPKVEDLSTPDCIRYRVTRTGVFNGNPVAAGIGECSSDEEKYKWRAPVCKAEYEATPEDRRRVKWNRDGSSYPQVRTNPADVANTILKMADKRAFIAMSLLATAASDIFTQDLEDLPPEVAESIEGEGKTQREQIKEPAPKKPDLSEGKVTFLPAAKSTKAVGDGTKYAVKDPDNIWYSTFDDELGKKVLALAESRTKITLGFKIDGDFKNITSVEEAK